MSSEYLEKNKQFWSCEVKKKSTIVRSGKVGADGEENEEVHASLAAAKKAMTKMVEQQLKKGFKRKEREDDEEDEPPKKKAKAKPKPKPKAGKKGKKAAEEDEEMEEEEPAKQKPTKKSKAASPAPGERGPRSVDRLVAGRDGFKVYEDYTCKLNQTNIGGNNNKYYIIQVLEKGGGYWTWNRWGRVGEDGQNKLTKCANAADAIKQFEKKFKDKSVNHWSNRANFVPHPGKYTLIETEEDEGGEGGDVPLGKLSKPQIEKGQAVLEELEVVIDNPKKNTAMLNELSSKYFTLIPTDWGRRRPEPITSKDKLLEQAELLKFYLRMGFQDMDDDDQKLTPINGLSAIPVPSTLMEAAKNVAPGGEIGKCVFKGKGMEDKQAGGPTRKMTKEAYGSIFLYTGNTIYQALNKALRDENRAKVKQYFNYLRLLIDSLDSLPKKPVTLWRGIGVDLFDQYKVGTTITWWSVSSCTADANVAKSFMNGCGGKKTLITVKSKTATDISMLSFYANEKESLLAPGTQLKVVKAKRNGDVAEIEMEEVGRLIE